jgi:CrcB protein
MFTYIWVAAGGAIGTLVRFWLSGVIAQRAGEAFPLGTLAVNVTGCLIAGLFVAMTGAD